MANIIYLLFIYFSFGYLVNCNETSDTSLSKKVGWDKAVLSSSELGYELAKLSLISSQVDFPLDKSGLSDPDSFAHSHFKPGVIHVLNKIWYAMTKVGGSTQKIKYHSMSFGGYIKRVLNFLKVKNGATAAKFANISLIALNRELTPIESNIEIAKDRLAQSFDLLNQFVGILQTTQANYAGQSSIIRPQVEDANENVDERKNLLKEAKREYELADDKLDRARKNYEKAMKALSRAIYGNDDVAVDDDDDEEDGDFGNEPMTQEKVELYRGKMDRAQKNYDTAFKKYQDALEQLKDAHIKEIDVDFENKRIDSAERVLPLSIEYATKAYQKAQDFKEFFPNVEKVFKRRLTTSMKNLGEIITELASIEDLRSTLAQNDNLRQRLIVTATKVINDSAVIQVLTTTFAKVETRVLTNPLGEMQKLQTVEREEVSEKAKELKRYRKNANKFIQKAIQEGVEMYEEIKKEWKGEIGKFLQDLGVEQRRIGADDE